VFALFKSRRLILNSQLSTSQIRTEIARYEYWYHRVEFKGGIQTPAAQDSSNILKKLEKIGLPRKADGLRVMDIGCADGFFSFAMERKGAEVVAVDFLDVSKRGFGIMKNIIGSKIEPHVDVIYNLTPERYGKFDIILFMGVLYHLRHPLLGLDRARALLKTGGKLFIETEIPFDTIEGENLPLVRFYPLDGLNGDFSNYFVPNRKAIEAMLVASEFKPTGYAKTLRSRACYSAIAVNDSISAFYREQEWTGPSR